MGLEVHRVHADLPPRARYSRVAVGYRIGLPETGVRTINGLHLAALGQRCRVDRAAAEAAVDKDPRSDPLPAAALPQRNSAPGLHGAARAQR